MSEIIIAIVGASGILASFLKYRKYTKIVKEVIDILQVSIQAAADGKLTTIELERILKEIFDVVRIVKPGLLPPTINSSKSATVIAKKG